VIVPGKSAESLLVQQIELTPKTVHAAPKSGDQLSPQKSRLSAPDRRRARTGRR
jgi:hypothetical protein